jgi:hypothetical protein
MRMRAWVLLNDSEVTQHGEFKCRTFHLLEQDREKMQGVAVVSCSFHTNGESKIFCLGSKIEGDGAVRIWFGK